MGVVDNVKDIADLVKKIGDIELYKKILALEMDVMELTRDKARADGKIEDLERALKFKSDLQFRDPYYWIEGDPTPFCPACWDSKRVAARVVRIKQPFKYDKVQCPSCKNIYNDGISAATGY
jgi:hypothetical protein